MERFVFIAAITFAVIWGIVGTFGGGNHWNITIDGDEFGGTAPVVEVAPGRMEAQAFSGTDGLRIKHTAARITIVPEDRQDYLVEIDNESGRLPMPTVSSDDGRVVIDGQLRGRVGNCLDGGGADVRGYGEYPLAELPQITIRAPRALLLELAGASTTEIGATESLTLDMSGCGAAVLADTAGELSIDLSGSGDVRAGAARALVADLAGSGTIQTGAVAERAEIDIAGSGEVTLAALNGSLSADGAGSGGVTVQGGSLTTAKIDLAGSGDVAIAAPVQSLAVSIMGSGDVEVSAAVGDLDADVAGSGTVSVQAVTGTTRQETLGSGEVRIGGAPTTQITP